MDFIIDAIVEWLKGLLVDGSGIGENKLRELMDNGELEYVQNGNRRLIADTAIWDWYERAKTAVKPPAEQGG